MATTKDLIATDSAAELHKVVGDDATSTFESDSTFIDSNPAGGASSENVEVQRDTEDASDSDEELDGEDADENDIDEDEDEDDEDDEAEDGDEEEVEAEANLQRT